MGLILKRGLRYKKGRKWKRVLKKEGRNRIQSTEGWAFIEGGESLVIEGKTRRWVQKVGL